jgi:hypothetical protein
MTLVVSVQVFDRICHFPQGEARLWLDDQVGKAYLPISAPLPATKGLES